MGSNPILSFLQEIFFKFMNYILKLKKLKIYKKNFISEYIFNIFLFKQGFQKKSNFTMKLGFIKVNKNLKTIFLNKEKFYK